jgi:hypothetical protein
MYKQLVACGRKVVQIWKVTAAVKEQLCAVGVVPIIYLPTQKYVIQS